MINRPLTVAAATEWLRTLDTHPTEWWADKDNQLDTVRVAEFYKNIISPLLLKRIYAVFQKNTSINPARIEAIFKLNTVEDMQRAVQWPGVQKIDRSELHTELYPTDGWIGEYLHYSQGSEIPMAWHFWLAVGLIGAACRRNINMDMGTFRVYPYWYVMVIEETASAKSTAFGIALDMLSRCDTRLENEGRSDRAIHIAAQSSTLPAFLDNIKSQDFLSILPDGSQISGKTESCAVLPVDELVSLLGKTKHNPEEWVGFLTDLFGYTRNEWRDSKVSVAVDRVLVRPAISFWAGSTMEWIKSSITDDMFAGGFLGRFVFIKRRGDGKVVPRPAMLDPVWAESLAEFLSKLAKMDFVQFKMDAEATTWHDDWYYKNKSIDARFQGDKFQAYFRRKQSHMLRLAMCLSVARGEFICDLKTLKLASDLLCIEEEPMEWIFNDLGSHPDKALCDYLLQVISKERSPLAYSVLLRNVRHKTGNAERTKQFLRTLENAGEIVAVRGPKGGLVYSLGERAARRERDNSTSNSTSNSTGNSTKS